MRYSKPIFCKKDYDLLRAILNKWKLNSELSKVNFYSLSYELQNAEIVDAEKIPEDVIRLNSIVDLHTHHGTLEKYQLVVPAEQNLSDKKLSISSPLGSAIIGYASGDEIKWHFPIGERIIKIIKVYNDKIEKLRT